MPCLVSEFCRFDSWTPGLICCIFILQSLQALEKISHEHPTACLRAGILMAVLSYLDFFSTGVQVRTSYIYLGSVACPSFDNSYLISFSMRCLLRFISGFSLDTIDLQFIGSKFFLLLLQRVAVSIAANICRQLPSDASDFVMEAVPLLTNLLQYQDSKVL